MCHPRHPYAVQINLHDNLYMNISTLVKQIFKKIIMYEYISLSLKKCPSGAMTDFQQSVRFSHSFSALMLSVFRQSAAFYFKTVIIT